MTKEQKLAKIYEVIANKELSFGCKILNDVGIEEKVIVNYGLNVIKGYCDVRTTGSLLKYDTEKSQFTVIGHPVMIGDVLDWIEKHKDSIIMYSGVTVDLLMEYWKDKRLPIDDNPDAIDYVYSDFIFTP